MGKFTESDIELAQKVQEKYGVPASVTLAQYALESGYGSSTVGKNNYFNIKGNGAGGYRDYNTKEDSFMDYGRLLSTERYTSQTSGASNVSEYVQGVKNAGYAEDSEYTTKLMSIIDSNDLTQYDTVSFSGTTSGVGNDLNLKWWGDVVIVVFAVLLIVGGVVFLGVAFMDNSKVKETVKTVKKIKGGGK